MDKERKTEKLLLRLTPTDKKNISYHANLMNVSVTEYRKLKDVSKETGEKLCYKVVSSEQFAELKEKLTMENVAAFRKSADKFNLVFLESQKSVIEKALGTFKPKAPNANPNLKL